MTASTWKEGTVVVVVVVVVVSSLLPRPRLFPHDHSHGEEVPYE